VTVNPYRHFEAGPSIANRLAHEEEYGDDDRKAGTKGPNTGERKLGNEDPTATSIFIPKYFPEAVLI
jgi:hypothetical protein